LIEEPGKTKGIFVVWFINSHIKVEFKGKSWVPKLVLKKIIFYPKSPVFYEMLYQGQISTKFSDFNWNTNQYPKPCHKSNNFQQNTKLGWEPRINQDKKIPMVLPSQNFRKIVKGFMSYDRKTKQTTDTQKEITA